MIDAGAGPAIWDAFYPRLCDGGAAGQGPAARLIVGTNSGTASGFTDGGFWYIEKDLRTLNGDKLQRAVQASATAAAANRATCANAVWAALEAVPGDPDALRADANAERIAFRPGPAPDHDPLHEPPERDPAGDLLRHRHR